MDLLYIWLTVWIIFIIIEMATVSLYWLSISISAFILVIYVYLYKVTVFSMDQFMVFCALSVIFVFLFPKMFHLTWPTAKIGLEAQAWKTFKLKKVWEDWKINIDWVDYLVDDGIDTTWFESWKQVDLTSASSWIVKVTLK